MCWVEGTPTVILLETNTDCRCIDLIQVGRQKANMIHGYVSEYRQREIEKDTWMDRKTIL